jgi:hypothetical protein
MWLLLHRAQVSDLQVSCTAELIKLRQRRLAAEADALLAAAVDRHRMETGGRDSIPISPPDLVRMRGQVLTHIVAHIVVSLLASYHPTAAGARATKVGCAPRILTGAESSGSSRCQL